MRLVFMGTPDFSVAALDALVAAGHDIAAVYSQPPRPAGRGKKEQKSPVHMHAEALGLTVLTPISMKQADAQAEFAALNLDCAVVVAYGQILPQAVLDAPRLGCVNIHASLLPRWRGAAPIHRAILAGDTETGVCIMQMDAGLDTGSVLMRGTTAITPDDTTATLHDRLAALGAALIVPALEGLENGTLVAQGQADDGVTYASKIDKAESHIDWALSASEIDRLVRGMAPFPGAWTELNGERIKILAGQLLHTCGTPGVTLDDQLLIGCGDGAYRIEKAQRAGKAVMDRATLMRGYEVPAGTKLC